MGVLPAPDRVSERDWRGLDEVVSGRVLRPSDAGFGAVGSAFNERFAATTPAGVVTVADTDDIRHALAWARTTGISAVVRAGGHSYSGASVGTGLVIDLSRLRTVTADGRTGLVTAAAGATMSDVYAALQPHEMAFALGNGASVGIAGLTLGGGCGATSRVHGLTADALVATTVLTADGELLHCDARENADLFWACRGGGGGNFGVTTSFTFQARPVADCSTYLLLFDRADAEKVFTVAQQVVGSAPDEFAARTGVARSRDGAVVSVIGQHLGPAAELREILDPVLSVARPLRADIRDRTYWEAKDDLLHETAGGAFAVRTDVLTRPLPDAGIETMLALVDAWPGSGNPDGGGAALFSWGGAINRVGAADTAFPHRDAMFLLSLDTSWVTADAPATVRRNLDWLAELREALAPYGAGRSYLNFADPDLAEWRTAYHGANYPRLVEVKNRYDPEGFFTAPQGVGT
ncbi:FAD-binding oxidoreductase [Saccharothrix variisporea]|uniref:FAD/FMN-containing dehydrogenase n=1 Tax=Saccharothrix variisporea TaxID=543527 RepID=A0A495XNZ7_9PSEU|nr:FAD-binding oxidoreductase [Saccharothrix variisporea]RKT74624.1 FAD/FMN-containing dehydrogenase [Saccharothrix variisporea]